MKDPGGTDVFWFAPTPREGPEPGTDRHAIEEGLVSITPLRLDLTDEAMLAQAQRLPASTGSLGHEP